MFERAAKISRTFKNDFQNLILFKIHSIKLQFLSVALNAWRMEGELCHQRPEMMMTDHTSHASLMSHPSMLSPLLMQAALSMQWLASKSPPAPAPAPICRLRSNLVMASESDIITVITVTVLIIIMV